MDSTATSALARPGEMPFVPADLAPRPQWLVWRFEGSGPKPRKVPYYAAGGRRQGTQGSASDRAQLVTAAEAWIACQRRRMAGIGLAFLPDDGLIGIDLDGKLDMATGEVDPEALGIIAQAATYCETSPSGTGFHLVGRGTCETFKDNGIGIEVFCGRQFFAWTGSAWGQHRTSEAIPEALLADLRRRVKGNPAPPSPVPHIGTRPSAYGARALERACATVARTPEGSRNDSLNREALGIAQLVAGGEIDEHAAREQLTAAALASGLELAEITATLRSAFRAGARHPRTAPEPRERTPPPGERGESGETPRGTRDAAGRTSGESGRILGEGDVHRALLTAAARLEGPAPTRSPYPVHALGPLAPACRAIVEAAQAAPEIVGQCLLAAASALVQSQVDAGTAEGPKPSSLNLLTIATSGDGKSTVDKAVLRPLEEHQRETARAYREDLELHEIQSAGRKKSDPPLDRPREPYLLMRDGTVEGIRRGFRDGLPSQACFTSEAAAILCGYGMSQEHRAKTAANFNALWDCGEISVARGTTGRLQLYDRRLALHWLIQPDAAREALHSPVLSAIGFWPRFLIAWPEPGKPRRWRPFDPAQHPEIVTFWNRCRELLRQPLGEDCHGLEVLLPDAGAMELAGAFFERIEVLAKGDGGELRPIRPFASRALEQAFRVAAVLAHFGRETAISQATMRNAITLVTHSLETWHAIFGDRAEAEGKEWATSLYTWLVKQPRQSATETAILRIGPKALRSRFRRDTALALLEQSGLARHVREEWFAVVAHD